MTELTAVQYADNIGRIEQALTWFAGDFKKLTDWDREFYFRHKLKEWQDAQIALAAAKEKEMELRKVCVALGFDTDKTGTQHHDLGGGYDAKAVVKMNWGFVKTPDGTKVDKRRIESVLSKIEATGPVGELIANDLVKWTPDLSLTTYNKLLQNEATIAFKAMIDEVIVKTNAAPTLDIIAPKGKK